jgi:hypothetical protein
MRVMPIPLLLIACCIGCTHSSQPGKTERNGEASGTPLVTDESIVEAFSKIQIGLSESKLMEALKPKCLCSGTVYLGGTGARKHDQQIWFEVAGPSDGNKITEIGPVEPKTKWTRHDGDSITVERQNAG